ncbi:uncharacterized protein LOC127289165 [Leptopilina boulardi]|uniref:uncharacterized protein LOC127284017 n=1 Tax=Leptopilina boulardi TaxID=63433 RepID=UPI0021F61F4B|nr:uncharacterized protein LOC127284017 [Leptopilina boulardi]XP_051172916.1 uncharacterized protein LOC127289165 [Leptopilina boulardi]
MPKHKSTKRVRKHRLSTQFSSLPNISSPSDDSNHEDANLNENISSQLGQQDDSLSSHMEDCLTPGDIDSNYEINESEDQNDGDFNGSSESEENEFIDAIDNFEENEPDEIKELQLWAVENGIEQNSLDEMLKILRRRLLPELPKSAKTFLGTSTAEYEIQEMADSDGSMGEYVYFGIKNGLEECIDPNVHTKSTIFLQINADGIALSKSGVKGFWVLSGKVYYKPDVYKPFPILIYSGNSKPADVSEFLKDFIEEINILQSRIIMIANNLFKIRIHCFICDTPSRAFLKGTVGHVGIFACERCETQGLKENGVTQFPIINCKERTDESFRKQNQPGHHKRKSPLLNVKPQLNMIAMFVLDFMHLFCEGVMKRLLLNWFVINTYAKLGQNWKTEVSRRLLLIRRCIPCEFQRKSRSLKSLCKWKATEFRFFLLYCGPIVIMHALNSDRYKNFLLLHSATRILCSDSSSRMYQSYAKSYLEKFFLSSRHLYFRIQVLNMHHAIHAVDDVIKMGCTFSEISAFPFENYLGKLTKLIRTPNRPLSQICRRLHEIKTINPPKPQLPVKIKILKSNDLEIFKLKYKECTLTTKMPDNFVILKNRNLVRIRKIYKTEGEIRIEGNIWDTKNPIFTYPLNSKLLNMWELRSKPSNRLTTFNVNDIKQKMVKLSLNFSEREPKKHYCMPLLHQ